MNWRIFIIVFILTFGISLPAMMTLGDVHLIGNHQGYQPEQPLPFSHSLHAGQLALNCQYCHSAADESRHASVPSLSTCMNCHNLAKGNTEFAKANIAKIAAAYEKGEPVRWQRVHNLPDFVHFNHSAHVTKGVDCQTCHGNVPEMGVMRQNADLTMGWCVNCHRDQNTLGKGLAAPTDCDTCHH
ncbi:MAG: cytochrome c3 family protein [Planctomycetes bacterium]|nr:cytochrome c3 family protein [Planctomycetota bacterium]